MSLENSPRSFEPDLPPNLETLIERVIERTLARIESVEENPFISSRECARLLGVTPEHLCAMRARGDGPLWTGDGRWIRYDRAAVIEWLADLPTAKSANAGGAFTESSLLNPADTRDLIRTGAPGRPSSMHLIAQEFERRVQSGDATFTSLAQAASTLREWFQANHSSLASPSSRTIENRLRPAFRRAKAAIETRTKL